MLSNQVISKFDSCTQCDFDEPISPAEFFDIVPAVNNLDLNIHKGSKNVLDASFYNTSSSGRESESTQDDERRFSCQIGVLQYKKGNRLVYKSRKNTQSINPVQLSNKQAFGEVTPSAKQRPKYRNSFNSTIAIENTFLPQYTSPKKVDIMMDFQKLPGLPSISDRKPVVFGQSRMDSVQNKFMGQMRKTIYKTPKHSHGRAKDMSFIQVQDMSDQQPIQVNYTNKANSAFKKAKTHPSEEYTLCNDSITHMTSMLPSTTCMSRLSQFKHTPIRQSIIKPSIRQPCSSLRQSKVDLADLYMKEFKDSIPSLADYTDSTSYSNTSQGQSRQALRQSYISLPKISQ